MRPRLQTSGRAVTLHSKVGKANRPGGARGACPSLVLRVAGVGHDPTTSGL